MPEVLDIVAARVCLTDSSRCQVEHLVPILVYFLEEIADAGVGPIVAETWHDMTHYITTSDRAIDIRDDNLAPIVPQEDLARDLLLSLQTARYRKGDQVLAWLKVHGS